MAEPADALELGEIEDFGQKYQKLAHFKPQMQLLNLPGTWEEDIVEASVKNEIKRKLNESEATPAASGSSNASKLQPVFPKSLYEYDEEQEEGAKSSETGKNIRELLAQRRKEKVAKLGFSESANGSRDLLNVHIPKKNLYSRNPKYEPSNADGRGIKRKREESELNNDDDDTFLPDTSRLPWLVANDAVRAGRFPTDGKLWLHNEILEFVDFIDAKPEEKFMRNQAIQKINTIVKEYYPRASTVVFGSVANDLCIPESDVDLVLFDVPNKAIDVLSRAFRSRGIVEYMEVIRKARIPIIKLRLNDCPYTVDISFNQQGGPQTGKLIRKMLNGIPTVRPLVLVIKYFLAQRDLNETYRGGVGSHCCLMTVISMLQHCRRKLLYRKSNGGIAGAVVNYEDLGSLLLEYLDLYGRKLNFANICVRMSHGGNYCVKPSKFRENARPGLLCIENPEETNMDIGKSSFQIAKVRKAFGQAHQVLLSRIARHEYLHKNGNRHALPKRFPHQGYPDSILSAIIAEDKILQIRKQKFYS